MSGTRMNPLFAASWQLTPVGEELYRSQTQDRAGDDADYDLRRAWATKGGGPFPPPPAHLEDMGGKLPNHPTFSVESPYSTPQQPGGHWVQLPDGRWSFWPSQTNYDQYGKARLEDYFRTYEPNNLLMGVVR